MASAFLELPDGKLHYEVRGEGPPVLLIHGGTLDLSMWDLQVIVLERQFRVIRYDVRGYGKSPAPETPFSHFGDIKMLLDYLNVKSVHLIGLSFGGGIAINFALSYPKYVDSIITLSSTLGGHKWGGDMMDILKEVWMDGGARPIEETKELWIRSRLFQITLQNREAADSVQRMVANYSGYHWKNKDTSFGLKEPAITNLDKITVPTLSIVGERDMGDYHQIAKTISEGVQNGKLVTLPKVGHMVNIEAPDEINQYLAQFLGAQ